MNNLIKPHGGQLCELIASKVRVKQLQEEALQYSSLTLNGRQICDLEMLLNGGFSPLKGFLDQEDYDSVLVAASTLYEGNGVKTIMQGEQYRKAWSTPVKVPILFLMLLDYQLKIKKNGKY